MSRNDYKRGACACLHVKDLLGALLLLICFDQQAQDTVALNSVEVSARKIELSQIGKKVERIDSTVREQFRFSSVADLLAYNSSVFIKSYGPGQLATTAFRGGNASQTAVLWNGFNLQNAMLGQADLALMPSVLFEEVEVEYGGSSSQWGSGAIGGSILLNNKLNFNKGLKSAINLGVGSFGAVNSSAAVLVSKKRFISSTKVYLNNSRNDFKYKDTADREVPIKKQKDAEYNFKGLMQEFRFLLNAKNIVSANAWINSNMRHLPNYNAGYASRTFQRDDAIRLSANWSYVTQSFRSLTRGAYFIDRINYDDSIASLFTKSKVNTLMLENENYFELAKNYQLNIALNFLSSSATTENYVAKQSISRVSLLLGNKFSFLKERLVAYVSARVEHFSVGTLPVTGNASLDYRITKLIRAKINAARVYRQPTLNELYWVPGGNRNLKPEKGYTYEGELIYTKQFDALQLSISGSAYSRIIDNWILWVPGANGNPSPVNIQSVWSRGTESSWKLVYLKNKFRCGLGFITGYVLSTVRSNTQQNDNSVDKQLIYTPRYTVNGHASVGYANADLVFYHQYSGYRFTSSDNSTWLPPYQVSSLRFNYKFSLKDLNVILFAAVNNLFDTNYSVIAGRPMPLRYYEGGVSIKVK